MRIGLSPKLAKALGGLPDVSTTPYVVYDVTIVLIEEDGRWVDEAYRRLSPHFVKDINEAKLAIARYQEYANGKVS